MKKITLLLVLAIASFTPFKTKAQLFGVVTINSGVASSSTNFQSFTALATALNTGGISGPLTVNVAANSGPYLEHPEFNSIAGSSPINTITINGNNNLIDTPTQTVSSPNTILLNGTDYLYMNNLVIIGAESACRLCNGADYNFFSNCTFSCYISPNTVPVALTATVTGFTFGNSGSGNTWQNCTMVGGTCGMAMYATNTAPYNSGNSILNCYITDWIYRGILASGHRSITISGCAFDRPNATNSGPTEAIFFGGSTGIKCTGNCIQNIYNTKHSGSNWDGTGISYNSSWTVPSAHEEFSNNLITTTADNTLNRAFYFTDGNITCTGNTVICSPNSTLGAAFYQLGPPSNDSLRILNNYVAIEEAGSSAMALTTQGGTRVDYNSYYIAPGAYLYGYTQNSYQSWQALGNDAHGTYYNSHPTFQLTSSCGLITTAPVTQFSCEAVTCQNSPVQLTDLSYQSPGNWSWSVIPNIGVSLISSTSQNPQVSFSTPGSYTISLSTSNAIGAGTTHSQNIVVSACTGLQQYNGDLFKIYPNPNKGELKIETNSSGSYNISILNTLGEKVFQKTSDNGTEELNITELPKGVYFLRIEKNGGLNTLKLIRD